ncbi:MAG TPA: DUF5681 domain-containing protein [Caulobacter sp.]|nr:DUF5681 domain-containing protein [Caulobacter sp.]
MSDAQDVQAEAASAASKPARRPGDPYDVGYARPPKATQFKKGVSGNPKGRPKVKEIMDVRGALETLLGQKIRLVIEGDAKRVTVREALLLKVRELALRGDGDMQKLLVRLADWASRRVGPEPIDLRGASLRLKMAFGLLDPDNLDAIDFEREERL